jgi:membrane protein YdbS with pleckstrin-like domain
VEHPLVHTRAHTAALTRPIAAALAAVALLGFVVAVLVRTGRPGLTGQVIGLVAAGLAIWTLIRLVRSVWDWDRTLLLISEDELVIQRRGMRRSESIVPLRAIHRLRVRAGPAKGSRLRFVPRPDEVSAVISAYAGRHDVR